MGRTQTRVRARREATAGCSRLCSDSAQPELWHTPVTMLQSRVTLLGPDWSLSVVCAQRGGPPRNLQVCLRDLHVHVSAVTNELEPHELWHTPVTMLQSRVTLLGPDWSLSVVCAQRGGPLRNLQVCLRDLHVHVSAVTNELEPHTKVLRLTPARGLLPPPPYVWCAEVPREVAPTTPTGPRSEIRGRPARSPLPLRRTHVAYLTNSGQSSRTAKSAALAQSQEKAQGQADGRWSTEGWHICTDCSRRRTQLLPSCTRM
ncbi:hypothetical protein L227DRAFT_73133 [Lentinus tigrinus ALCF2SS1-6]|uniref:Uncharacterized protein n=1 Tax=Lentinus tigrinus ALCF2SS1-6 TaxID=1328759 RepID=A0A5C2SCZ3_9APHY|nr:hypothetical protein L227DRAFT_73133 [Lentinus tigrinus ALCF2SS1-6]